ncbi:MAG: flavodoxin, partial [Paludibacteraceae bacterium]
MKQKLFAFVFGLLALAACPACANDTNAPDADNSGEGRGAYFGGQRVLVVYFSWSGTTRRMAQEIQRVTNGHIFEIVPVNPYPAEYTPCTEVALAERDNNARP